MAHQQRARAAPSRAVIERAVGEWRQRLPLVFLLEADILSHAVIKMMCCDT